MSPVRVAVIDDDEIRRDHLAELLAQQPGFEVAAALDHDRVAAWNKDAVVGVDVALVDVHDDQAPHQTGTDLFSGIGAVLALSRAGIPTVAVVPHRHHPLVERRIEQSGVRTVIARWDLHEFDRLVDRLADVESAPRPRPVHDDVLWRYGAARADTNEAVRLFVASEFHGRLTKESTLDSFPVTRRYVERFLEAVQETGFVGPPGKDPGWPAVKLYLLALIGRIDAPPSDTDGHTDLWVRG